MTQDVINATYKEFSNDSQCQTFSLVLLENYEPTSSDEETQNFNFLSKLNGKLMIYAHMGNSSPTMLSYRIVITKDDGHIALDEQFYVPSGETGGGNFEFGVAAFHNYSISITLSIPNIKGSSHSTVKLNGGIQEKVNMYLVLER